MKYKHFLLSFILTVIICLFIALSVLTFSNMQNHMTQGQFTVFQLSHSSTQTMDLILLNQAYELDLSFLGEVSNLINQCESVIPAPIKLLLQGIEGLKNSISPLF